MKSECHSVMSNCLWSHGLQLARLLGPWDSPGRIRSRCHFLLQGISPPRDWTLASCIAGGFFTFWATDYRLNPGRLHMHIDLETKSSNGWLTWTSSVLCNLESNDSESHSVTFTEHVSCVELGVNKRSRRCVVNVRRWFGDAVIPVNAITSSFAHLSVLSRAVWLK